MAASDLTGAAALIGPAGLLGADRWARWRAGFKAWVEDAYLHPGTAPYQLVFNLFIFLVLVSLISMVLEGVSDLEIEYAEVFFVVETVVILLFVADYVESVYSSKNRWAYVFSFWGLVDLLAIMPYFLTVTNISGLRAARTLHSMRTPPQPQPARRPWPRGPAGRAGIASLARLAGRTRAQDRSPSARA